MVDLIILLPDRSKLGFISK